MIWLSKDQTLIEQALSVLGVPAAVIDVSKDTYTYVAHNKELEEYYQIPNGFFKYHNDLMRVAQEHESDVRVYTTMLRAISNYQRCKDSGSPYQFQNAYTLSDGTQKWSANTMVPIKQNGLVERIFVTVIEQKLPAQSNGEPMTSALQDINVCAWCSAKVRYHATAPDWVSFDRYLLDVLGVTASHGICHECVNNFGKT